MRIRSQEEIYFVNLEMYLVLHLIESVEPKRARDEILSSLSEIFNDTERVFNYLFRKRRGDARWLGALVAAWVFLFLGMGLLILNQFAGMRIAAYFDEHPGLNFVYLGFSVALGLMIGFTAYSHAKRRYKEEFIPWKTALDGLRKAVAENKQSEGVSIVEKALQLIDQTSDWLPDLVKYKNGEAFTYGFFAWLIAAFITFPSQTLFLFDVIIGVIVWLYFRDKKRKKADQLIKKLKDWKAKLEESESDFLKSV